MRFQAATPVQSVLFEMGDAHRFLISDENFVNNVDSTGTLVAQAAEILSQAEFAQLVDETEVLDYGWKIDQITEGVQEAQRAAPVDGTPAIAVIEVNRQLVAVLREILNKISALKTTVALAQVQKSMANKQGECKPQ